MGGAGGAEPGVSWLGAVAVFLMTGGLGEGQERCDETMCIEYPEEGSGAVDRVDGGGPGGEGCDVGSESLSGPPIDADDNWGLRNR